MSNSKDMFYEDKNGDTVFIPEDKTAEQIADDIQAAEEPRSQQILIPQGKTLEDVVDDIHAAGSPAELPADYEEPDGERSDILERALEDKTSAEDTPGAIPLYHPGDLVGYAEGRVGNVQFDQMDRMVIQLDNSEAGRSLKALMVEPRVLAMSLFEAPPEGDDYEDTEETFERDLSILINRYSLENDSGTPDYILAKYLVKQLDLYNETVQERAGHQGTPLDRYGHETAEQQGTAVHAGIEQVFLGGNYVRGHLDQPVEELLTTSEPIEYPNTPYNPDGVNGVDGSKNKESN